MMMVRGPPSCGPVGRQRTSRGGVMSDLEGHPALACAELRALSNKQRKTGKAAPKRLTTHQKQIVERLIAAHGDDVEVGARRGCSRGPVAGGRNA